MADSRLSPHQVSGRMRGVSTETDSSDESSQDTIELENVESCIAASRSHTNHENLHLSAEHSNSGGARAVEVSGTTTNEGGVRGGLGAEAPAGLTDAPSAFGIAYKACRVSSALHQGYDLPSGPAFADEDEFEQEMGAEFRVAPELSTSDGIVAAGSKMAPSDDFSETCGTEDGARDPTRMGQKEPHVLSGGLPLQGIGSTPTSSMLSRSTLDKPAGNGSLKLGEGALMTPSSPNGSKLLDSEQALKQVANEYKQAGSALKHGETAPPTSDLYPTERAEEPSGNSQADTTRISIHAGEDVRRFPVMEEDDEEGEEAGEEVEEETKGGGEPKGFEVEDLSRDPSGQEACEEEQRKWDDQDDVARRALVAREWEVIDQLRTAESAVPMEIGVGGSLQPLNTDEGDRVISTGEVLRYFRSQDLTIIKDGIIPFQPRETRFGLFRRTPTLKFPDGNKLRDEVFVLAQIKYTPDDVVHRRLIQTIYKRLTKEQRTCPDVGSHWDTIGFQGTDPSTDLNRSMGVLALFQVLHLLESQLTFAILLHRLSLADGTGWPFLCVSIGFTKEALGVLRRGSCYSECNRKEAVMEVVNELHQAQFHAFLELCKIEPATHHALHLAKVRSRIEIDSHEMVKAYRAYLSERETNSAKGFVENTGGAIHEPSPFSQGGNTMSEGHRVHVQVDGAKDRINHYLSRETTQGV